MSKGSSKAPPSPDYVAAAKATAQGNIDAINAQTAVNRYNQTTPYGSTTWTQGANGQWSQTQTLSPEAQAATDAQLANQTQQAGLVGQAQQQVSSQLSQPFTGPNYSSYFSNVPGVQTNYSGFNGGGVPALNTNFAGFNTSGLPSTNTSYQQFDGGSSNVNLNAPQFDQSTANDASKAAYNSQVGLLQDQWNQDNTNLDSQLRLQGLTPGSEAYNNAMQNQLRVQGQQKDQLANQSVITGNNFANQNYASALAGYQAGNAAQGQQFNQALQGYGANLSGQQNYNQSQQQAFNQALAGYGANQQAEESSNNALNQAYQQQLTNYQSGQQATQNYNTAQNQAYQQALNNYQQNYNQALQQYQLPLNALSALQGGQQLQQYQAPTYQGAGVANGPDLLGATQSQANYNQGLYNSQQATNAANNQAYANLFGTILSSYFNS